MSTQTQPDAAKIPADVRDALLDVRDRLASGLAQARRKSHPAAAGLLDGEAQLAIRDINDLLYDSDGHLRDAA